MRIKTFYTKTMSEAFREIKKHLGADAILLSSKEIPHRSGVWGRTSGFEVVAACDDAGSIDVFSGKNDSPDRNYRSGASNTKKPVVPGSIIKTGTYSRDGFAYRQLEETMPPVVEDEALLSEPDYEKHHPSGKDLVSDVCRDLINRGIDAYLAKDLLSAAMNPLTREQRQSRAALLQSLMRAASSMMPESPDQNGMPGRKIVAFVGPTGVGKTTSIAKLAARLSLKRKKNVVLITTDGYRIGAIDQLRTYAGLIGVPFRFVDQVSDLDQVIVENSHRDYILIDTAGRSPRDLGAMTPLAEYLSESSNIEKHLVLSATTNPRDLRDVMDRFEVCAPDHLLFTKVDETSIYGPILNEIIRTQKSFAFYCDGQGVPEDLHTATRERIIDMVLN